MTIQVWPVLVLLLLFAYFRYCSSAYQKKPVECGGVCSLNVRSTFDDDDDDDNSNLYFNLSRNGISTTERKLCYFARQTLNCENRSKELARLSVENNDKALNDSLLKYDSNLNLENVTFTTCPYNSAYEFLMTPYIYNDSHYQPHVRINISIKVTDPSTTAIGIRQVCISHGPNPSQPEELCKNHSRPAWGRFYWPCRLFEFSRTDFDEPFDFSKSVIILPMTAYYDCFRASDLALMSIHVTLYPQMCENFYNYRMPTLHNVMGHSVDQWFPLMYVDTSDNEGVRIRFNSIPSWLSGLLSTVVIEIVDESNGEKKVIRSKTVNSPKTEAFISDLKMGEYTALLHVWHRGCSSTDSKCLTSYVPFNLSRDYMTRETPRSTTMSNLVWILILIFVVFIVLFIVITPVLLTIYYRRKIKRRRREAIALNFVDRPKVFLVYTDDNLEHRKSVILLAEYLRDTAHCEVFLDEWSFRNPSLSLPTTTEWVYRSASKCDYFLLLFSEGCKYTFDTPRIKELRPERPWPETFGLSVVYALEAVMQETQRDPRTKLPNLICCTFAYSPANYTPSLFKSLPCRNYRIPDEIAAMLCHLHKLPLERLDPTAPLGCTRLIAQVDRTRCYYESNPNWINERLIPIFDRVNRTGDDSAQNGSTAASRSDQKLASIFAAIESLQTRNLANGHVTVDSSLDEEENVDNNLVDLYIKNKEASKGKYPLLPPPENHTNLSCGIPPDSSRYLLLPPDDDDDDNCYGPDVFAGNNNRLDFPLLKLNAVSSAAAAADAASNPSTKNDFSSTDNLNN